MSNLRATAPEGNLLPPVDPDYFEDGGHYLMAFNVEFVEGSDNGLIAKFPLGQCYVEVRAEFTADGHIAFIKVGDADPKLWQDRTLLMVARCPERGIAIFAAQVQ